MNWQPLPLSPAALERYRIKSRYQDRPALVGGHQMRRKGQSLEFYDYRPYVPGDDIRHVDWRASARHGSVRDLLVRNFVAEEQLTIIISLDTRETMQLPAIMSKLQIALWLAEAAAWIALRSDDQVILHRLFGNAANSIKKLSGAREVSNIRRILRQIHDPGSSRATINLGPLERFLKPAVVWLIITDLYFDMDLEAKILARKIAEAHSGLRWIILMDMDSWPLEKTYLGQGARKIKGPGLTEPLRPCDIDPTSILTVETEMRQHKQNFRDLVGQEAVDFIDWQWPAQEQPDPVRFFEEKFGNDRVLQRLFMKETR